MYSVSIVTKPAESIEPQKGLKSLSLVLSKKQTIEIQTGLKSLSICIAVPGGGATRINHYRNYVPVVYTVKNIKLRFHIGGLTANTNDGYPADGGFVQIFDNTTKQILPITDSDGTIRQYKNNPYSYDISYFDTIYDGGTVNLTFTDYGQFANAGNWLLQLQNNLDGTITAKNVVKGGTITFSNIPKAYLGTDVQPLEISLIRAN